MTATARLHRDPDADLTDRLEQLTAHLFSGDAISVNAHDLVGGGKPCVVTACPRSVTSGRFCPPHHDRWRAAGMPADHGWDPGPPVPPRVLNVGGLPRRLQMELAYGIDRARTHPGPPMFSLVSLRGLVNRLRAAGISSVLEHDESCWPDPKAGPRTAVMRIWFVRFVIDQVDELAGTAGVDAEFNRDTWRLRRFGLTGAAAGVMLKFDVPQPWLREAVKRFIRWRIARGHSWSGMNCDVINLNRLAAALTSVAGPTARPAQFNRAVIERFLVLLVEAGLSPNGRVIALSSITTFFTCTRRHDWIPGLPPGTAVYSEDIPARTELAARALPEYVMVQLESATSLAKLTDPRWSLLVPLLIQTGLRVGDAVALEMDCVTRDAQHAPYLRYRNHKMKREALVPITEDLAHHIHRCGNAVRTLHPQTHWLFPRVNRNPTGDQHTTYNEAFHAIRAWLTDLDVRNEAGQPVHITPHQFRHTLGTRLINNDVPQEIVRRLLDHSTVEMTAHYARLHDTTIRDHWERARKVTITGEPAVIPADSPLGDAAWMKQHLARATMALPNGYCGLPLQQTCPHANACLTCPVFITTPEFLDSHREQLAHTKLVLEGATRRGQLRLIEMNQKVADNLTTIITALETDTSGTSDVG